MGEIERIHHIGVAVASLEEAIPFYRDVLGLRPAPIEEVADQQVRVACFEVGESRIELLEPTSPTSPIAAFLDRHGPGIHHIAYQCQDLAQRLRDLTAAGVPLIDREPRAGAHGMRIAFLHPKGTGRVLTELCEGD